MARGPQRLHLLSCPPSVCPGTVSLTHPVLSVTVSRRGPPDPPGAAAVCRGSWIGTAAGPGERRQCPCLHRGLGGPHPLISRSQARPEGKGSAAKAQVPTTHGQGSSALVLTAGGLWVRTRDRSTPLEGGATWLLEPQGRCWLWRSQHFPGAGVRRRGSPSSWLHWATGGPRAARAPSRECPVDSGSCWYLQ